MKNKIEMLATDLDAYNAAHAKKYGPKKGAKEIIFDELRALGYEFNNWADLKALAAVETAEPINYETGRAYTGINKLLLPTGAFMTWHQIQAFGGQVKKGAGAYKAVYFTGSSMKYYRVFNAKDVKHIAPCPFLNQDTEITDDWLTFCDEIITA